MESRITLPKAEINAAALVLWAESPQEARTFLDRLRQARSPLSVDQIFVAKRSGRSRGNAYVDGHYFPATNDDAVDVYDSPVFAPPAVSALVQWCTCDVMLSRGERPIIVVEDTTHIVRKNLYQRIPRLAKASEIGVPAVILQGTRGLDFEKRGDQWALHRYWAAFSAMHMLYPNTSPLPITYLPNADDEIRAVSQMVRFIEAVVADDHAAASAIRSAIIEDLRAHLADGVHGEPPPALPCIVVAEGTVTVKIGAKPDKKSWVEKGSGQMDPYLGLIAAAKYIYCYDDNGMKIRDLTVEFTYIPEGFAFFKDGKDATALYKRLAYELSDRVVFLGKN
jgi:hypothetical protein